MSSLKEVSVASDHASWTAKDDDIEIITHETIQLSKENDDNEQDVDIDNDDSPVIDEVDLENFKELSSWLIKKAGILPSLDRIYCSKLFENGIGSVSRLVKKLARDPNFLSDIGIKSDDCIEILEALRSEGHLGGQLKRQRSMKMSGIEEMKQFQEISPAVVISTESEASNYISIANSSFIDQSSRRRYRHRGENSEKFKELLAEANNLVENLNTAVEGKMEQAVTGVLHAMALFVENSFDKQKVLFRANAGPAVLSALQNLGASSAVCESSLIMIALLCRHSEENKASVSYEHAKTLGVAGACEVVTVALIKYSDDVKILEVALDAIRCLCCLESNRARFGVSGACEAVGRCLTKHSHSPELCCWISRALGHLAAGVDENRELIGSVGACENAIVVLQKYQYNTHLCTEICWAIRNIAPTENNRARFANEHGPENLAAIYKFHYSSEVFAIEACQALVSLIASEDDDIIPRIAYSGVVPLIFKSYKRCSDSEVLARWVFNLMYYIACDKRLIPRLLSGDILSVLSVTFDNHAGYEPLAEWGLRTVSKLARLEGILTKMRNVGLCEVTISTVQRQAISTKVCGHGCLAIGELATDSANHDRLSTAGACEAVIGALRRHDTDLNVVSNACYAIHFLSGTPNLNSWLGANGAAEVVTNALQKHIATSDAVTTSACRAIGSLAYHDEGNISRLRTAGACDAIVRALRSYASDPLIAEYTCRAIYHLCYDSVNVGELGRNQACGSVVAVLQTHANRSSVVSQACLAIHGLAVKIKQDKPHGGNTRKLVEKGAIEVVVAVMQKFPTDAEVQQACALAISSLGRLEPNRNKLGSVGACELIIAAVENHASSGMVVGKLALAVEVLSQGSDAHKTKFADGGVVGIIIQTIHKQEKNATIVSECFKALIVMITHEPSRPLIRTEQSLKQFVKCIRFHEKDAIVARWGCNLIYMSATDDMARARLGTVKACEAVTIVLNKHAETSASVAAWGCKALFALSVLESNKSKFANSDSCHAVIKALKENYEDIVVAEWACAAIVSIAPLEGNRLKLGSGGGCQALQLTLSKHMLSEVITRLACEAVYELSSDPANKSLFGIVGICETLVASFSNHINSASVCQQIFRAITALARGNSDNATKFGAAGVAELIGQTQSIHSFNIGFSEWSCAAVTALADKNPTNQTALGNHNVCENLISLLKTHRSNETVIAQATRAVRAISNEHVENIKRLSVGGIVGTALASLKVHIGSIYVAENCGWILARIPTPVHAEGNLNPEEGTSLSVKDLYKSSAAWDLLALALQSHTQRENTSRWLCAAIQSFAQKGQLPHVPVCDAVIAALSVHVEKENVLNQILMTIGDLAEVHVDNSSRLSRARAFEYIDGIFSRYSSHIEPELIYSANFRAITGLVHKNPINQEKANSIPTFAKNVLKALYNDLESESVSKWGCAAISALSYKHRFLQAKLGPAGNYLIDIIQSHKSSMDICLEVSRAVSRLAHGNMTNRNRLGASGICDEIPKFVQTYLGQNNTHQVIVWTVRAIADLAANNPNNQTKLGIAGACESLVAVLRSALDSHSITPESTELVKWTCWAIGNIVQLGKGPTMIIDESISGPKLGQFKALRATQAVKNTARLASAGIAELIFAVLNVYSDNQEVLLWCLRAVNNLAKSRTLKNRLLADGVLFPVKSIMESTDDKEVKYWATSARETLSDGENRSRQASASIISSPIKPPLTVVNTTASGVASSGRKESNVASI